MQTQSTVPGSARACTLRQPGKFTKHCFYEVGGFRSIESTTASGATIRLQTPYFGRHGDPSSSQRPGVWYGSETRLDSAGREWTRYFHDYVVVDFGNLVEVPK